MNLISRSIAVTASGAIAASSLVIAFQKNWQPEIIGSGVLKREQRATSNFDAIKVSGSIKVVANSGGSPKLEISGDDNIIRNLRTEVTNGELRLWVDKSYKSKLPIQVTTSANAIRAIDASGATEVRLNGSARAPLSVRLNGASKVWLNKANPTDLRLDLSGAANLQSGPVTVGKLEVNLNGASKLHLVGIARTAEAKLTGASNWDGSLTVTTINADLSGASNLDLNLKSDSATIKASGAAHSRGTIRSKNLTTEATGAASIKK